MVGRKIAGEENVLDVLVESRTEEMKGQLPAVMLSSLLWFVLLQDIVGSVLHRRIAWLNSRREYY